MLFYIIYIYYLLFYLIEIFLISYIKYYFIQHSQFVGSLDAVADGQYENILLSNTTK